MPERRFDNKEVGEILKTAAEIQSGLSMSGSAEGMTLTELQAVAQEVGIDSRHITRAANELVSVTDVKKQKGSDSFFFQNSVKGQLSQEGWEEIVTELRRHTAKRGKEVESGETKEWVGNSDLSSVTLSATVRNGRTRLKLYGETAGASALTKAMGIAFAVPVMLIPVIVSTKMHLYLNPGLILVLCLYFVGLWSAACFGLIRRTREKFSGQLELLLGRLVALAQDGVSTEAEGRLSRLELGADTSKVSASNPQNVRGA